MYGSKYIPVFNSELVYRYIDRNSNDMQYN